MRASDYDGWRRRDITRMTPAELAIREAILAVEAVGADVRLTEAVILLVDARERLADFVDGIKPEQAKTRDALIAEVEQLREALEEIQGTAHVQEVWYIAQAALEEK